MDKKETVCIKGIAIILMFFHHLVGCEDFLMSANYLPKPILGEFEVNLARQSKICIALFHNDHILYVSLSWYVKLYLEFLVILPLLKYISRRIHSVISELLLFVLVPIQLVHFLPDAEEFYLGKTVFVLSSVRLLFTWLPVFCTGIILAKYKFFEYISPLKKKNDFRLLKDGLVTKIFLSILAVKWDVFLKHSGVSMAVSGS